VQDLAHPMVNEDTTVTGFTVIEQPRALEPVTDDPFIEGLGATVVDLPGRPGRGRSADAVDDLYVSRAIARAA
jgi:hypothetical protein